MNNKYDAYLCRNPEHDLSGFYRSLVGKSLIEVKSILRNKEDSIDSPTVGIHHVDGVCVYIDFFDKVTGKKFSVGDFSKTVKAKNGQ